MAPRDVEVLLSQADSARTKALTAPHPRMGPQMAMALDLLADHAAGDCPQISFYTVSLMAEAVYYFLDPNGVIPDWMPDIGRMDDALVLELAFELGVDGVARYCAWKGIPLETVYGPPRTLEKKTKATARRKNVRKTARRKTGAGTRRQKEASKSTRAKKKRTRK